MKLEKGEQNKKLKVSKGCRARDTLYIQLYISKIHA